MDFVVNNEEAVVVAVGELDECYCRILFVMFLKVGKELLGVSGMDGGRNAVGAFGEEGKHTVVNEIVNEDNSVFGAANEVGNVLPFCLNWKSQIVTGSIVCCSFVSFFVVIRCNFRSQI